MARILWTRHQSVDPMLQDWMVESGDELIVAPMIDIQILPMKKKINQTVQAFFFSSAHAVQAAPIQAEHYPHVRIYAMGPGTAQALVQRGWRVDWIAPAGSSGESILIPSEYHPEEEECLLWTGTKGRHALVAQLKKQFKGIERQEVYSRKCVDRFVLQRCKPTEVALFYSMEALRNFITLLGPAALQSWLKTHIIVTSRLQKAMIEKIACFSSIDQAEGMDGKSVKAAIQRWKGVTS